MRSLIFISHALSAAVIRTDAAAAVTTRRVYYSSATRQFVFCGKISVVIEKIALLALRVRFRVGGALLRVRGSKLIVEIPPVGL